MLTKISRASPSSSARRQSRSVWTSTPITPLTTKTAASTTRRAPSVSATKLGSPGVSIMFTLRPSCSNEVTAAPDRHPPRLLVGLEVADGRPVVDASEPVDDARLEQDRLGEAGLAAAPVADEGDVADPVGRLVRHAREPYNPRAGAATA